MEYYVQRIQSLLPKYQYICRLGYSNSYITNLVERIPYFVEVGDQDVLIDIIALMQLAIKNFANDAKFASHVWRNCSEPAS